MTEEYYIWAPIPLDTDLGYIRGELSEGVRDALKALAYQSTEHEEHRCTSIFNQLPEPLSFPGWSGSCSFH